MRSGRLAVLMAAIITIGILFGGISYAWHAITAHREEAETASVEAEETEDESDFYDMEEEEPKEEILDPEVASFAPGFTFERTGRSTEMPELLPDGSGSSVVSKNAVLVDLDTNEIVTEREADTLVVPASMTKVLTLLVAVEHIDDLDAEYKMTKEIADYSYQHDCSVVGFMPGEKMTMRDLLYGAILPSGADAVLLLCDAVAGGQDAFVEMMNEKVDELGLSGVAHFTNAIGLYDDDLHCTVADMAGIMKAALMNDVCREVLAARVYTTTKTKKHPDGITISNWFLRRIEDQSLPGEVLGAKTGFVDQSGFCAVSYLKTADGHHYVCVTTNSISSWRCIHDHEDIYNQYVVAPGGVAAGGEATGGEAESEPEAEPAAEAPDGVEDVDFGDVEIEDPQR